MLEPQRVRAQAIDDDPLPAERLERHRHVKVVAIGVQGQIVGRRQYAGFVRASRRNSRRPLFGWDGTGRRRGTWADSGRLARSANVSRSGRSTCAVDRQDDFVAHSSARLPHVEFQLPAPGIAGALARQLERPDLGDSGVQPDRHRVARVAVGGFERGLERIELLKFLGVPASSMVPTTSSRRVVEPRNRNWAGSPTIRPISGPGTLASVPSSMPIGTTQRALIGGRTPGTAGAAVSRPT